MLWTLELVGLEASVQRISTEDKLTRRPTVHHAVQPLQINSPAVVF